MGDFPIIRQPLFGPQGFGWHLSPSGTEKGLCDDILAFHLSIMITYCNF